VSFLVREKFEAWVKEGKQFALKVDSHGFYCDHTTRVQYEAYQAAYTAALSSVKELKAETVDPYSSYVKSLESLVQDADAMFNGQNLEWGKRHLAHIKKFAGLKQTYNQLEELDNEQIKSN